MKQLFVVQAHSGEYEDARSRNVRAFLRKEAAVLFAKEAGEWLDSKRERLTYLYMRGFYRGAQRIMATNPHDKLLDDWDTRYTVDEDAHLDDEA